MSAPAPPSPAPPAGVGRGGTFSSLRTPNARKFFLGMLVSTVGTWMQSVALSWLVVSELGGGGVELGVVAACQFLPMMLLGPWAGALADRHDKRRITIAAQATAGVLAVVLAVVVLAGAASLPAVYALTLLTGTAFAFDAPARRSMVAEIVPPSDVANAMSLNTAVMTGSRVAGAALGGLLLGPLGSGWIFMVNGWSYLAVLWALLTFDLSALRPAPHAPQRKGAVRQGFAHVWGEPVLRRTMVVLVVISTFTFNYQVTLPLVVERVFRSGSSSFGLLLSVVSVGSLLGSLVVARTGVPSTRVFLLNGGLFGLCSLALGAAPSLPLAFAVAVPMGATGAGVIAHTSTLLTVHSRPEFRGRVLALQSVAFLGSTPVGGPIVGAVAEWLGPRWGLYVGGVAALAVVTPYLLVRSGRPVPGEAPVGVD